MNVQTSFNSMSVLNDFVIDSKTWAKLWIELKLPRENRQNYSNWTRPRRRKKICALHFRHFRPFFPHEIESHEATNRIFGKSFDHVESVLRAESNGRIQAHFQHSKRNDRNAITDEISIRKSADKRTLPKSTTLVCTSTKRGEWLSRSPHCFPGSVWKQNSIPIHRRDGWPCRRQLLSRRKAQFCTNAI